MNREPKEKQLEWTDLKLGDVIIHNNFMALITEINKEDESTIFTCVTTNRIKASKKDYFANNLQYLKFKLKEDNHLELIEELKDEN